MDDKKLIEEIRNGIDGMLRIYRDLYEYQQPYEEMALKALDKLEAANAWQDIAEYDAGDYAWMWNGEDVVQGEWDEEYRYWSQGNHLAIDPPPTHFMPIERTPKPPSDTGGV